MLQVIYLIFTEGSFPSGGEEWIRTGLAGAMKRVLRYRGRPHCAATPPNEPYWNARPPTSGNRLSQHRPGHPILVAVDPSRRLSTNPAADVAATA